MKKLISIFLFFVSLTVCAQVDIQPSDSYQAVGSSGSTTIASPSITAAAGDYWVAVVHSRIASGTAAVPTMSGLNVTWQQVATVTYDNATGGVRRITAFVGIASAGTTSTVTATWAVSNHQRYINVFKVTGAATTNNGVDGVAQAVTGSGNSATPTITMAARQSNSSAYAFYGMTQSSGTATVDGPYSTLATGYGPITAFGQPITLLFPLQNGGTDNTPSLTLSSAYDWGGIALEFKVPSIRRIISTN
jgi:hypothetical protein